MLREIKVDGFRSLIDFSINLSAGINVIVGANGTGKTNFVSFMDFLGEMVDVDLNAAIAVAQGAGSVFSKEKFQQDSAELNFSLSGDFDTDRLKGMLFYGKPENQQRGIYFYAVKIIYLKDVPAVIIDSEHFFLQIDGATHLAIIRSTSQAGSDFRTHIEISPENHPLVSDLYSWNSDIKEKKISKSAMIAERMVPERLIFSQLMGAVPAIAAIAVDLASLRSINIDPSIARLPTPVAVRQDIGPKGEGLAGALYRMSRGNYNATPNFRFGRSYLSPEQQKNTYESIQSWCREINPDIVSIDVNLDFQEALIRPYIIFSNKFIMEKFPFSRISDGTVKWLALLAVLHVESSLSTIEEPENFLHPFMQESFIALCRKLFENDPLRVFVISTHSPIILDFCKPSEMIIFELEDGITQASKVANRRQLEAKIATGRFGLGHYYRTGGVYSED